MIKTDSVDDGYSFESCLGGGDVSDGERDMLKGFFRAVERGDSFHALSDLFLYEEKSGKSFYDMYGAYRRP